MRIYAILAKHVHPKWVDGPADNVAGLQTIRWLWDVVHEFSLEEQRHFLKFFTGSDRAPIGGLGNQRCIIQVGMIISLRANMHLHHASHRARI